MRSLRAALDGERQDTPSSTPDAGRISRSGLLKVAAGAWAAGGAAILGGDPAPAQAAGTGLSGRTANQLFSASGSTSVAIEGDGYQAAVGVIGVSDEHDGIQGISYGSTNSGVYGNNTN